MAGRHTSRDNTAFPRNSVDANKPYSNPKSEGRRSYAGSRTVNVKSRVPMSVQEVGKSRFGSLSSGDSGCERGQIDDGKGKGFGGSRP